MKKDNIGSTPGEIWTMPRGLQLTEELIAVMLAHIKCQGVSREPPTGGTGHPVLLRACAPGVERASAWRKRRRPGREMTRRMLTGACLSIRVAGACSESAEHSVEPCRHDPVSS